MLIDFRELPERTAPGMHNGTGAMTARMYAGEHEKIIPCTLHARSSIGLHRQENGDEIVFVLSGVGYAVCDGVGESLYAGACHICRQGSEHTIVNPAEEDLVLLTIVVDREKTNV